MRTSGDSAVGDDALDAPDDTIREHALLIARGVRPMALVDVLHITDQAAADKVHMQLMRYASEAGGDILPFVVKSNDVLSYCGFAAASWVIDLMQFAVTDAGCRKHQIIGLLLGYSASAIQYHEDFTAGARWPR